MKWKRQPEERPGQHAFAGKIFYTSKVAEEVPLPEILAIVNDIRTQVKNHGLLSYFQVYQHSESGRRLYFINELPEPLKHSQEEIEDYCTIMFPEEY